MKKNAAKVQRKRHSDELVDYCNRLVADDEMNGISIAYFAFNGAKLLKELPPDAPSSMRKRLEAFVKFVKESKPVFNALRRQLNDIAFA